MGSHGIRNRQPHNRRMTDAIQPEPTNWSLISAGIGFCAIVAVWAVLVLILDAL